MRTDPAEVEDVGELSKRSGSTRALLITTQQLQGGSKVESLKDGEPVGLDARGSEGEATGGGGGTGPQNLEHEEPEAAPVTVDGVCGDRMRCTREWLAAEEQRLIELKADMFGDDLQE